MPKVWIEPYLAIGLLSQIKPRIVEASVSFRPKQTVGWQFFMPLHRSPLSIHQLLLQHPPKALTNRRNGTHQIQTKNQPKREPDAEIKRDKSTPGPNQFSAGFALKR
jgi:hypothetical protein